MPPKKEGPVRYKVKSPPACGSEARLHTLPKVVDGVLTRYLPDDGGYKPGDSKPLVDALHELRPLHKKVLELKEGTSSEKQTDATPDAVELRHFLVAGLLLSVYTDADPLTPTRDIADMLIARITQLANHLASSSDAVHSAQSYCNAMYTSMLVDTNRLTKRPVKPDYINFVRQFDHTQVQEFILVLLGEFVKVPTKKLFLVIFMFTQMGCVSQVAIQNNIVKWSLMQVCGPTVQNVGYVKSLHSVLGNFASETMKNLAYIKAVELAGTMVPFPYNNLVKPSLWFVVRYKITRTSYATSVFNLLTALTLNQPIMLLISAAVLAVHGGAELWDVYKRLCTAETESDMPETESDKPTWGDTQGAIKTVRGGGSRVTAHTANAITDKITQVVGCKRGCKRGREDDEEDEEDDEPNAKRTRAEAAANAAEQRVQTLDNLKEKQASGDNGSV